jgi:flagellar motility protein MotE (MotC chaperone)
MTDPRKSKLATALKAALLVKLVFLGVAWALLDQGLYLGDAPTLAADEPAASVDKPGAEASEGKDEGKDKEGAGKTRQSFLSNLLELPPLNTETIQKDELGKYLEIAERKKRQLEERMDVLKAREEQLKKLESSIDDKLRLLDDERRFFAQTIQQEKDLKGERVDKLVTMYAKMEPKKAAPVFEKLDKDLVVELFKQLPQKQVTAILETMNPERSVFLSEYYGRVRSAREYDLLKEMNQSLRKEFDECKGMPAPAAAAE